MGILSFDNHALDRLLDVFLEKKGRDTIKDLLDSHEKIMGEIACFREMVEKIMQTERCAFIKNAPILFTIIPSQGVTVPTDSEQVSQFFNAANERRAAARRYAIAQLRQWKRCLDEMQEIATLLDYLKNVPDKTRAGLAEAKM